MNQPGGNIRFINDLADLGMPKDPPMTQGGIEPLQDEIDRLCSADTPSSRDLRLETGAMALYDRIDVTAGKIGEIVGRTAVTFNHTGLLGERVEYGSIARPGLVLYEHAVPPGPKEKRAAKLPVDKRLVGYIAFKKEWKGTDFSGSIQLLDPLEVTLDVVCGLKSSTKRGPREEMWKFASSLGLGELWVAFERAEISHETHISVPVGRRMGRSITAAAEAVRLSLQA